MTPLSKPHSFLVQIFPYFHYPSKSMSPDLDHVLRRDHVFQRCIVEGLSLSFPTYWLCDPELVT